LGQLNHYLESRSYITGYGPTADDVTIFRQVPNSVDAQKLPNIARWHSHVASFAPCTRQRWRLSAPVAAAASSEKTAAGSKHEKHGSKHEKHAAKEDNKEEKKGKGSGGKKEKAEKGKKGADSEAHKNAAPVATPSPTPASTETSTAAKADAEPAEVDPFADDDQTEEEKAREKEYMRIAADKHKKDAERGKKVELARSMIVLDVKPLGTETDMKALEACVRSIEMDGLQWKGAELKEIAYGVQKLQIICIIEDDKVPQDSIQEAVEKFEDFVQSTDIVVRNRM